MKHEWNLILAVCYQLKQLKKQPEKKIHSWPCNTGAMLYPLSYQATWIDGQLWVCDIPDDSEIYEYEYMKIIHLVTIDHLSMWLGSSVDRALHRYGKVMASNPVQAWIFFRLLFQLLKLIAQCEDQISFKLPLCMLWVSFHSIVKDHCIVITVYFLI